MMFLTHTLFSVFLGLLLFYFDFSIIAALFVLFGGIFPDIDQPKSKIGRKVFVLSFIINFLFGHRKFIHSLLFGFILLFLFSLFDFYYGIAFFIGFIGHLLLDGLTRQGVQPFYPVFDYRLRGFIKTNSFLEYVFSVLVCFGILVVGYFIF